jgi:hypothetical protein
MPRSRRLVFVPLLLLFAAPEAAAAATVLDTRVAPCAPTTVFVPGAGVVDVSLQGERGDWDVTLTDAKGREVAAGASPDAQEVASGVVTEAGVLTLKACGGSGTAAVKVTHSALKTTTEPPQMVSVATPTRRRSASSCTATPTATRCARTASNGPR